MPQVTVYIRQEDIEAWKGVHKKSEFMHNALEHLSTYDGAPIVLRETLPTTPSPIEQLTKIPGITTANKIINKGACRIHGTPLTDGGKCLQKGCKYV
jgi:hypothetical protein